MAARKPVRFADMHDPEVVERQVTHFRQGSSTSTGQVPISFTCPFCLARVSTWLWSLSGGGKRCQDCKAIIGSTGAAFQWKDKVL